MPATIVQCLLPYRQEFEKTVTEDVRDCLDDRYYLIHNFVLPPCEPGLNSKEIDLGIVSTRGEITLIEIKDCEKSPQVTPSHLITAGGDRKQNPIEQMRPYAQDLYTAINRKCGLAFYVRRWLVLKSLDPEKIHPTYHDTTFNLEGLLRFLSGESRERNSKYSKLQVEEVIRARICDIWGERTTPFRGFDDADFDLLRRSADYESSGRNKEYYETVKEQLHPKFRWLSWEVLNKLGGENIKIYPHIQKEGDLGTDPISWLCFTMEDVEDYKIVPQLGFHISATDWYRKYNEPGNHFAVKLAFFRRNRWLKSLINEYKDDPKRILNEIMERLGKRRYWFSSGITKFDPFIIKPIIDPEKNAEKNLTTQDLDRVYERIIKEGKDLRHVAFEKPFYWNEPRQQDRFSDSRQTLKLICDEFRNLVELAKVILPDYFREDRLTGNS